MNLRNFPVPQKFSEMVEAFETYKVSFTTEMGNVSNANLEKTVERYILMLQDLSKSPDLTDIARASMGIVSLHEFGYNDFHRLTLIFDRIIPQTDPEYVKFTSWCAGRLVHHPGIPQSNYVSHLLERLIGWIRANGRRSRHLAAICILEQISLHAGSDVVPFFEQLQSVIWVLVSHPSMQIMEQTADAINMFTRAILRYRRSDLDQYLNFFTLLCTRLLSFGSPFRCYSSLKLFQVLLRSCPDYFSQHMMRYHDDIVDVTFNGPVLVKGEAYLTIAYFSSVDAKQFIDYCITGLLEQTNSLILEFPEKIVTALSLLIKNVPDYVFENIKLFMEYAKILVQDPENEIVYLKALIDAFKEKMIPLLEKDALTECFKTEISIDYNNFWSTLLSLLTKDKIPETLPNDIFIKVSTEYNNGKKEQALDLISKLPYFAFCNHQEYINLISETTLYQTEAERKKIPAALFQIAKSTNDQEFINNTIQSIFQLALFDPSNAVRCAILNVIKDMGGKEIASPESLKYLQLFSNDESTQVRSLVFQCIAKLHGYNPLYVTTITRHSLLESFYVIRNVPGIRLRAKTIKVLPDVIQAAGNTMKIYAKPFMEIASELLMNPPDPLKLTNFLEVECVTDMTINIIDCIALLAPIAPNIIADDVFRLIPLICQKLTISEDRELVLSVLHLMFVLMSPGAATLQYRISAPLILQHCSQFLAQTQSRKCRMATLRVIGAIGILEVHQKPPPIASQSPANIDEELAREFFTPSRDFDHGADDTMLLKPQTTEQYYIIVVATSLLKIFNDDKLRDMHGETAQALCNVLAEPRMFMLSFYDTFFTRLLSILEESQTPQHDFPVYLPALATIISKSSNNSTPFVKRTLKFIVDHFDEEYASLFFDVIISFCDKLRDAFATNASSIIQPMISTLESVKSTNVAICKKIFMIFSNICIYAEDLLYLLIPQIADIVPDEIARDDVHVQALKSLNYIGQHVELFMYFGPIVRAMNFGINSEHKQTKEETINLFSTLLKTHGFMFLQNAIPIVSIMNTSGLITDELKETIYNAQEQDSFLPVLDAKPLPPRKKGQGYQFSEDAIIARISTPLLGASRHLEQWLQSFMITCISSSPNDQIRSCTALATSYHPLAKWLFKIAFFSCWNKLSDQAKHSVQKTLYSLLFATENYETVAHDIMELIFFMNKFDCWNTEQTKELVNAALKYGFNAFALCLQEGHVEENGECIITLIETFIKLGERTNAVSIWEAYIKRISNLNKQEILSKLHKWDLVLPVLQQKFSKQKDVVSFTGLIKSMSHLGFWQQIMETIDYYSKLTKTQRRELASYFGNAAYTLERWDDLDKILQSKPDDSIRVMVLQALNEIRKGNYDVDKIITNAWSVLASRPITFWADNQQIHKDTMLTAQQIVEVLEIRDWMQTKNKTQRMDIEDTWRQRLMTAPHDFEYWFKMISNREKITHIDDYFYIELFQLKSESVGSKMNTEAFNALFPNFNFETSPDLDRICYVVNNWTTGKKDLAIAEMRKLTGVLKNDFLEYSHTFYATWILERDDSKETLLDAYSHLKEVPVVSCLLQESEKRIRRSLSSTSSASKLRHLSSCAGGLILPSNVVKSMEIDFHDIDVLRKWADINTELAQRDPVRLTKYITNAIDALTKCCIVSPSFTDVVQLFNLFFEHAEQGDVFEQSSHCILQVPDHLLIHASSQLLVQLSHPSEKVASFVHDLMFNLLHHHYHALIFSLIVNEFSKDELRAQASKNLFCEFRQEHEEESDEVILIRKCLLRAAVTWYEKCCQFVQDAYDTLPYTNKHSIMLKALKSIVKFREKPKCELHHQFLKQYGDQIETLEKLLHAYSPSNQMALNSIMAWLQNMNQALSEDIKRIHTISLSSLSSQLGEKQHFKLAVPGTYKPGKDIIRIKYFVGQFTVYATKQQPKDVIVRGEDGNFYQYLVKGHEDLRLDERIMQFFRLINTFLRKDSSFGGAIIGTIAVIPLSTKHGLVSWVRGTDTLRVLVENYRKLYDKDTMEEFTLIEKMFPTYDYYTTIQKTEMLQEICSLTPETDIANFFKLKAETPEVWLKQTKTFATSTAMTSIVGYIIGLGDRHPSNLLIDRLTGKVVHIDFGDCFERATKRSFLPEVIPFRLTRMMIAAMGVTGVHGIFYSTFVNTSYLLRDNRRVLVMVLSIFVHEPLAEPEDSGELIGSPDVSSNPRFNEPLPGSVMDKGRILLQDDAQQTSIEMRNRVNQKLCGTDFDTEKPLTVEEQADILIKTATDPYELAKLYSGWCAFW